DLAAAAVARAASKALDQAGPGGQLRDEASCGEIDARFDNLGRDDNAVSIHRASGAGQEALAPTLALGGPETAVDQLKPLGPSRGAKGVEGPAGSVNRVAHDEGDSATVASRNAGMLGED